jgi:hypothetical protein
VIGNLHGGMAERCTLNRKTPMRAAHVVALNLPPPPGSVIL